MENVRIWLVGVGLVTLGVILQLQPWVPELRVPPLSGVAEGLMVAGILSLFVDPLLKKRLMKEASQGIFHHLLGFDQQPEIKERLRDLAFKTTLFRKDLRVSSRIVLVKEGVKVEIELSSEMINPTNRTESYRQYLAFEKVVNPTVEELNLLSHEKPYTIPGKLKEKPDEPGVLEVLGPEVKIRPSKEGARYIFSAKYSVVLPGEFYLWIFFGHPTIGAIVLVDAPELLLVSASPASIQSGRKWEYDNLFMPGEHLTIRWRPSVTETLR
jgi:hypothetical protein